MRGTRTLSPVPCVSGSYQKARHETFAIWEPTKLSARPRLGGSHIWLLGVACRKGTPAPGTTPACWAARGERQTSLETALPLLLSLSPGVMGAGREVRQGLAGWVIASYRQVDDCHRRLPEDIETGATSEARCCSGKLAANVSAQGSALPLTISLILIYRKRQQAGALLTGRAGD